ncbi:hypothetical protein H0H87_009046 [Tephrocybe sp. NHM501043]|nr:hypothetical protein H0H87_009046 [Tephrocybe sp. NHM501043]
MLRASSHLERLHCCALRRYATYTRQPRSINEETQLPRYLRRQSEFRSSQTEHPSAKPSEKVYRSRHFDPATAPNQDKSAIKLLEPHTLSGRLKKLCDANKIDQAVAMLKSTPRDAQNTQVWNTLIWECMKAKRFNLSYQLYTDMKRRGFSPTSRTFQTMFTGLSKIENWTTHMKQLANARLIYDSYQRYMTSVKKHDPESAELSAKPLAGYIKLLGDNGLYQDIFDVYHALPTEGPMAPEELVYTAMFKALASTSTSPDATPIHLQNAAHAKLLWTTMQKSLKKSNSFEVDAYVVAAAIGALSRGKQPEIDLAFSIVNEYYGLVAPGDPPSSGRIPLSQVSLDAVLKLCNASTRHSLCAHFVKQVKSRPVALGGEDILDHGHLNEVLRARIALPDTGAAASCLETLEWMLRKEILGKFGYKLRPTVVSYNLAMAACWRDGDWRIATRIFDLMTGYHAHDFMDGAVAASPRKDARSAGKSLDPTAETLASFVRTALKSHDRANTRQALRVVEFLKADRFFAEALDGGQKKAKAYFVNKLASAVVEAVQFVSGAESKSLIGRSEMDRWRRISDAAVLVQRKARAENSDFIPTMMKQWPQEEEGKLSKYKKRHPIYV